MRTLYEGMYIDVLNVETALGNQNYPASASYKDVSDFQFFGFLVGLGALDSAIDASVYQDTDATETASIKAVTGAAKTDIAGTDDNKWFLIEVETAKLDIANAFTHVTLKIENAAGANDYGTIVFLGWGSRHQPVTQPTNFYASVVAAG